MYIYGCRYILTHIHTTYTIYMYVYICEAYWYIQYGEPLMLIAESFVMSYIGVCGCYLSIEIASQGPQERWVVLSPFYVQNIRVYMGHWSIYGKFGERQATGERHSFKSFFQDIRYAWALSISNKLFWPNKKLVPPMTQSRTSQWIQGHRIKAFFNFFVRHTRFYDQTRGEKFSCRNLF